MLGIAAPLRLSGSTEGSPGCAILAGERRVEISSGVIVAARHLHLSPEEAAAYGLKDGDETAIKVGGERGGVLSRVIVRSGPAHLLEAHIDTDEANALGIADGALCELLCPQTVSPQPRGVGGGVLPATGLLTEADVLGAQKAGVKVIALKKGAVVTPLARDAASKYKIELRM
jgi:putative phosphotransacetylase